MIMYRSTVFYCGSILICCLAACRPLPSENAADDLPATQWDLIVVEQGAGKVSILDLETGVKKSEVEVGYNPHEIALSRDGQTAYVSNFGIEDYDRTIGVPGLDISVIDLSAMTIKKRLPVNRLPDAEHNKAPHGVKLRPGRQNELFVNVEVGDSMLVYDTGSGEIRRSFSLPAGAHNFIFSPSGETLVLFSGEKGVFSFNPDTGAQLHHFATASASRGLTYTIDGKYLIVSCGDELYLLLPEDLSLHRHYPDLGVQQIIYSTPSPDGRYILAPCPYDGVVLVIELESGKILHRLQMGKAPIYVQVTPDKKRAVVANAMDDHLSMLDLATYEVTPLGQVNRPNGFGFIPKFPDR